MPRVPNPEMYVLRNTAGEFLDAVRSTWGPIEQARVFLQMDRAQRERTVQIARGVRSEVVALPRDEDAIERCRKAQRV